jgi:hypothetical protein
MEFPEIATRWTALAAMAGAAVVLVCRLACVRGGTVRWIWTISCGVFLAHVACAFQFYHHWSHADAYHSTALRTEQVMGVFSGAGLYLNYLFALLWPADVIWWWNAPAAHVKQPRWLAWTFGIFFAFMAVNATIVFGGMMARIVGGVCATGIVLAVVLRDTRSKGVQEVSRD